MIRILEITPNFGFARTFIGDRFHYLQQNGYEMHLICSPHVDFSVFVENQGIKARSIEISRMPSIRKDIKAIHEIVSYIREKDIDCVVGHADKGKLLAAVVSRITKKRLIIWAHGTPLCFRKKGIKRWFFTQIERFDTRRASKVICVSPFVAEARVLHRLDAKGKTVIPNLGSCNGLDCYGQFNPANLKPGVRHELRNQLGIGDSDFVVGFCGRFTHDKGVDELVPAFQLIKTKGIPAKLVMVGEKDIRDAIREDTERIINSDPDILCVGHIAHSEIQEIYSIFDLFVLPTHREGLPYVLLENESMGTPVLSTSITGSRDAMVDGLTGEYISIDIEDIAFKIMKLYHDDDFRKKLGKQARKWICDNFETHMIWSSVKKIYDQVLINN